MRKYFIAIVLAITNVNLWAQKDFKWDIITESSKTQAQLYADVKNFINRAWEAAGKNIVQEDEAKGFIFAKGNVQLSVGARLAPRMYNFEYDVKFYVKDNKYRIVIDNVFCNSAQMTGGHNTVEVPRPDVADTYPEKKGRKLTGMNKKNYEDMIYRLKSEIQITADSYLKYMSSDVEIDTDW